MRSRAIAAMIALVTTAAVAPVSANKKPWLGVMIATNCPVNAQGQKRPDCREGVRVDRIIDDTPAARAQLFPGDVIVKISGVEVDEANKLIDEIANKHKVGDVAALDVLRNGKRITIDVTLDAKLTPSELFAKDQVGVAARDAWRPLVQVKGKVLSSQVSSHRGDVVVVYIFASGCRSCAAITRTLESLAVNLGRRGLVVLASSEESPATLSRQKTRLPVFSDPDGQVWQSFRPDPTAFPRGTVPVVAVVGRDGVITHAALGDGVDTGELKAAIERAVRGTATATFR